MQYKLKPKQNTNLVIKLDTLVQISSLDFRKMHRTVSFKFTEASRTQREIATHPCLYIDTKISRVLSRLYIKASIYDVQCIAELANFASLESVYI